MRGALSSAAFLVLGFLPWGINLASSSRLDGFRIAWIVIATNTVGAVVAGVLTKRISSVSRRIDVLMRISLTLVFTSPLYLLIWHFLRPTENYFRAFGISMAILASFGVQCWGQVVIWKAIGSSTRRNDAERLHSQK